jgi:hypothetical protein
VIIVAVGVVPPPRWEGVRLSTSAEYCERKNEEDRERGAIKSASDKVRVILEDAGAVVPQVELDEEAGDDLAEDDAGLRLVVGDVAGVLDQLGEVDVRHVEALDFGHELESISIILL